MQPTKQTEGNKFNDEFEKATPLNERTAEWIRETEDESYLVKTKKGIFKVRELEWGKIEAARKRAEAAKKDPNEMILSDSIIGHDGRQVTFGELDIRTWKGGVVLRLLAGLNVIYDVDDFLNG